jgi:hypothetical protein
MFYILPPIINLIFLFAPIVYFRVRDYQNFKNSEEYKELREAHGTYWVYRSKAPRNPSINIYIIQAAWAAVFLIPLGEL